MGTTNQRQINKRTHTLLAKRADTVAYLRQVLNVNRSFNLPSLSTAPSAPSTPPTASSPSEPSRRPTRGAPHAASCVSVTSAEPSVCPGSYGLILPVSQPALRGIVSPLPTFFAWGGGGTYHALQALPSGSDGAGVGKRRHAGHLRTPQQGPKCRSKLGRWGGLGSSSAQSRPPWVVFFRLRGVSAGP